MSESPKPTNEIRIAFRSKISLILSQCEKIIKEENFHDLHLSAVGNSIGSLVVISEILKSIYPDFTQKTTFSLISLSNEKGKDKKPDKEIKKSFPRLEIIITNEKPVEKKDDAPKLTEEERKALIETMDNQKKAFLRRRPIWRQRRNFSPNRGRGGYARRNQRFAFSAKRTPYGWRRPPFNSRRPQFGRSPAGKRSNNLRKLNGSRKNSGNKPVATKN